MSFNSVNTQMMDSKPIQGTGLTPENKMTRLEIDNAYLTQQNEHLQRELSFARYTINALKTITNQKDITLQDTKLELERAYLRVKMLGISMMRQQQDLIYQQQQQEQEQQQQHYYHQHQQQAGPHAGTLTAVMMEEDKPMLIMDADSSDDQQELSDEEEIVEVESTRRPQSSIMTKLPLRQHPTMVFEHHQNQQQLSSPPTSPLNYNL
ncbi:unnamed protein product [Absidia cylindrospora]